MSSIILLVRDTGTCGILKSKLNTMYNIIWYAVYMDYIMNAFYNNEDPPHCL